MSLSHLSCFRALELLKFSGFECLKEVLRSFELLTVKAFLNFLSEDVAHTRSCNLCSGTLPS